MTKAVGRLLRWLSIVGLSLTTLAACPREKSTWRGATKNVDGQGSDAAGGSSGASNGGEGGNPGLGGSSGSDSSGGNGASASGGTGATGSSGGTGGTAGGGGNFDIVIAHLGTPTAKQKAAFSNAAARWSELIVGDLQDIEGVPAGNCFADPISDDRDIDDLLIYASIEPIDGPGKVLGMAGPCFIRMGGASANLPLVGVMLFDVDDVEMLDAEGDLNATILHEMGHVLGFGTLWATTELLQDPSVDDPGADTHFTGEGALKAFENAGGKAYNSNKVPVENDTEHYGPGSLDGHWREGVFDHELMTPSIGGDLPGNPLSAVTVAALGDLGYVVVPNLADAYALPSSPNSAKRSFRAPLEEVLLRPRFGVYSDGSGVAYAPP